MNEVFLSLLLAAGATSSFDPGDLSRYSSPTEKIAYVQNRGQWDSKVRFMARYGGANVWVTGSGVRYAFSRPQANGKKDAKNGENERTQSYAVGIEFVGSSPKATAVGLDKKAFRSNYYLGNDRSKWVKGAPSYGAAMIKDLYPGIDLVSYVDQRKHMPRYDLIVHPGADASTIKMRYTGANNIHVDKNGQIAYDTPFGPITESQQVALQQGKKAPYRFKASQVLGSDGLVSFDVGDYHKDRTLVIDPIVYSTFLGGSLDDSFRAVTTDESNTTYVAGATTSDDFPGTGGKVLNDYYTSIYSAVSADGTTLLWSTYLGGSVGNDVASGLAYVSGGILFGVGTVRSNDFPVTNGTTYGGGDGDGYIATLNTSDGSVTASGYIGGSGSDSISSVVTQGSNAIYCGTTKSSNLPVTNAMQTTWAGDADAFIGKVSLNLTTSFQTYYGGAGEDLAGGLALGGGGSIFVVGNSDSSNLPLGAVPFQSTNHGNRDAFVLKLSSTGGFETATLLGGSGREYGNAISVGIPGVMVGGTTQSPNFPVSPNATQSTRHAFGNGYLTVLDEALETSSFSTYFGGDVDGGGIQAITTLNGKIVIGGTFCGAGLPAYNGQTLTASGGRDAYASILDATTGAVSFTGAYGGTAFSDLFDLTVTATGNLALVGGTKATDFPTLNAIQPGNNGLDDAFLTVVKPSTFVDPAATVTSDRGSNPQIAGGVGLQLGVTVTLSAHPQDVEVTLTSPNAALSFGGSPTQTVTVPAGDTSATFTVDASGAVSDSTYVPLAVVFNADESYLSLNVFVQPWVQSVLLSKASVLGPNKVTAEVQVFEAPGVRTGIGIAVDSAFASCPSTVYVDPGFDVTQPFTINTLPVSTDQEVTVTATFGVNATSSSFDITTPFLNNVHAAPLAITAGGSTSVVVRYQAKVSGTRTVHVTSSDPAKFPSVDVTVFDGQKEGSSVVFSNDFAGTSAVSIRLDASDGTTTVSGRLTVIPTAVASVDLLRAAVADGNSVPLKITLLSPALGDRVIQITSNTPSMIPSTTATILDGEQEVTVNVPTTITQINRAKSVRITATFGASYKAANVSINPAVSAFDLGPSTIIGGAIGLGFVTLFEPLEYDLTLAVTSANSNATLDSPTLFIPKGEAPPLFRIYTVHRVVTKTSKITIANGVATKSQYLTIVP